MTESESQKSNTAGSNEGEQLRDLYRGCLLGGAVGDALGGPVEFMSLDEIREKFGPDGITRYAPAYGGVGRITDDTQMTLFTAEGLLRHWVRWNAKGISSYVGVTKNAYLRWLWTQGRSGVSKDKERIADGWLFQQRELHHARAPGNTCISALQHIERTGERLDNNSKGCGGVMRVAPVGLLRRGDESDAGLDMTFQMASELARITHGHPSGYLSAGAFAVLIQLLLTGVALPEAIARAVAKLEKRSGSSETVAALRRSTELAASGVSVIGGVQQLGEGWVAEEALAISVFCALRAKGFDDGVIAAVNHGGDSDSTGAIAGNILGAIHGEKLLGRWLPELELCGVIRQVADDLLDYPSWDVDEPGGEEIWERYPGH